MSENKGRMNLHVHINLTFIKPFKESRSNSLLTGGILIIEVFDTSRTLLQHYIVLNVHRNTNMYM